ncbi:MAG TPA: type II CAAX endopeptidase family protein [Gaiellaceae bacterium]
MSIQSATAQEPNLIDPPRTTSGKLAGWLVFVGVLTALAYVLNYTVTESKAEKQKALYEYSTAVSSAFLYAVMAVIVLAIAGRRRDLLALRRPTSWPRSLGFALAAVLVTGIAVAILDSFLHGGREQGLVPDHWIHAKAGAYAANWIAVAVIAPFVEELTYRGLGFSLVSARFGSTPAIFVIGLLFAASHGFLQAFPELAVLGCVLAWIRSRYDSVFPGMLVHCAFNSYALAAVFWS